jgi:hypothetical protein
VKSVNTNVMCYRCEGGIPDLALRVIHPFCNRHFHAKCFQNYIIEERV